MEIYSRLSKHIQNHVELVGPADKGGGEMVYLLKKNTITEGGCTATHSKAIVLQCISLGNSVKRRLRMAQCKGDEGHLIRPDQVVLSQDS